MATEAHLSLRQQQQNRLLSGGGYTDTPPFPASIQTLVDHYTLRQLSAAEKVALATAPPDLRCEALRIFFDGGSDAVSAVDFLLKNAAVATAPPASQRRSPSSKQTQSKTAPSLWNPQKASRAVPLRASADSKVKGAAAYSVPRGGGVAAAATAAASPAKTLNGVAHGGAARGMSLMSTVVVSSSSSDGANEDYDGECDEEDDRLPPTVLQRSGGAGVISMPKVPALPLGELLRGHQAANAPHPNATPEVGAAAAANHYDTTLNAKSAPDAATAVPSWIEREASPAIQLPPPSHPRTTPRMDGGEVEEAELYRKTIATSAAFYMAPQEIPASSDGAPASMQLGKKAYLHLGETNDQTAALLEIFRQAGPQRQTYLEEVELAYTDLSYGHRSRPSPSCARPQPKAAPSVDWAALIASVKSPAEATKSSRLRQATTAAATAAESSPLTGSPRGARRLQQQRQAAALTPHKTSGPCTPREVETSGGATPPVKSSAAWDEATQMYVTHPNQLRRQRRLQDDATAAGTAAAPSALRFRSSLHPKTSLAEGQRRDSGGHGSCGTRGYRRIATAVNADDPAGAAALVTSRLPFRRAQSSTAALTSGFYAKEMVDGSQTARRPAEPRYRRGASGVSPCTATPRGSRAAGLPSANGGAGVIPTTPRSAEALLRRLPSGHLQYHCPPPQHRRPLTTCRATPLRGAAPPAPRVRATPVKAVECGTYRRLQTKTGRGAEDFNVFQRLTSNYYGGPINANGQSTMPLPGASSPRCRPTPRALTARDGGSGGGGVAPLQRSCSTKVGKRGNRTGAVTPNRRKASAGLGRSGIKCPMKAIKPKGGEAADGANFMRTATSHYLVF